MMYGTLEQLKQYSEKMNEVLTRLIRLAESYTKGTAPLSAIVAELQLLQSYASDQLDALAKLEDALRSLELSLKEEMNSITDVIENLNSIIL